MLHEVIHTAWQPFFMESAVTNRTTDTGRSRAPKEDNLVSSWVDSRPTLAGATAELNRALGASYSPSRVGEWERGVRTPSGAVIDYMLRQTLPGMLEAYDLAPEDIERLVRRLTLKRE